MKRQVLVSLMVIAVLLFATIVPIQATWWNMDWKYKKIITITEQCMHAIEPTYSFGSEEALLSFAEQRVVALVNGSRAYNYDLDLESIAYQHLAFRSSGSEGANESANWIKEKFESFGLEAWLEPFEFTTWDLSSKPSLVIDDDGNPSTTSDQTTINSFQCEHYSWPTPESGTFADLVILPLPEAANISEIGKNPINTTEWDAIDTTGKIVLIGKEVRWDPDYIWEYTYQAKLRAQPPAAVVYTWWYDWMSFTPNFFSSIGGRPGSYFGPYYWELEIPVGFVNYEDGLWIRNREDTINVSSRVSIRSVIGTGPHYNVVGKISGYKNPEKIIIISAHYDTIMSGGFCDNGAGAAAIIEVAKVFTDAINRGFYKPKYTLLFVAFAGEELGLVGSINYIKQHKSEMANITAVINLDCIGSDELYVTETNPANGFDLDEVILDAAQDLGVNATLEPPGGSDQESFRDPSWANDIYYWYWGLEAGIADATPVNPSAMLDSYPMVYGDKWTMGTPGWIHTSYDNSTSTATLDWVEIEDLENHIKVAALTIVRISPNACIIVQDDYSTIQGAINAADTGDTIYVRKGTYYENVVVNKTISLIGESKENTIVDGGGTAAVMTVEADSVLVTGFTVRNSGWGYYYYESSGITLDRVRFCNVRDNIAMNVRYGISSWLGWNNSISGNTMSNVEQGVSFDGPVYYNNITRNMISDTYFGIMLWETSYYTTIVNNTITNSSYAGIYFDNGTSALVVGNTLYSNYHGIDLFQSNESKIYHNNFINNTQQVVLSSSFNTTWDDGYPSGGNYWSDYNGTDLYSGPYQNITGSDGLGDSPYTIDGNNTDHYPLMNPWAPTILDPDHMVIEGRARGNIDPARSFNWNMFLNVYETLIFFDREKINSFVPCLATSWSVSPDGLNYTFTIRQGVKFHNNAILTTQDVEYSFERILVIDWDSGPALLFYDVLFGLDSSRDEEGNIIVTAEQLDNAITRTDSRVTFHLTRPYPPFLQILSSPSSCIVNKDWCVALGEWPGTWNNWTAYNKQEYSPINNQNTAPPGPHVNAMCGTGPFMLDYYQRLVEFSLIRFDDYWGGWPAQGTNGSLQRVTVKEIADWATKRDMFLAGQLDSINVPRTLIGEVLEQPGVYCIYPLPELSCYAMLFTFNISTTSPYLGIPGGLPPGTFNESGIPPNFFHDINVRKGFAYAFNYTKLIEEALLGEACQPASAIIPGLPFYNPSQEKHTLNLTKAREYFEDAWGGQLWTNGFNMTICYDINGPFHRQKACEIIKANIESLNPKFHINVEEITWDEYWYHFKVKELPISMQGWIADFADPHDFALGFMKSGFGGFPFYQNYRNETIDALVEQGISTTNATQRQEIYYELQRLYFEDCPSVPLFQPRGRRFERDWVQGWYYNPLLWGLNYFYTQWKEYSPSYSLISGENVVDAVNSSDTMVFINTTSSGNLSIRDYDINIEGTIEQGIEVHSIKCVTIDTTIPPENITFPIEIRIYYTDQEVVSAYVDQSTLRMYYWNGTDWILENDTGVVTPSDKPGYAGYVWAKIYHLSLFTLAGEKTLIHALAARDARTEKTIIGQGHTAQIYVDIANLGNFIETFNITIYANTTIIGTFTNITLAGGNSTTITCVWNTSGFAKGNYTIWAYAWPVPGETDTADNILTDGMVTVAIVGDVNADGIVDIEDIYLIALAYGTMPGQPGYKPNLDINADGIIDIEDIYTAAIHYGETDT
jgi:peptide/nickel transport system substrate-binding protein